MTDLEIKEMMAAIGKKAKAASAELSYATAESKQRALIFAKAPTDNAPCSRTMSSINLCLFFFLADINVLYLS